MANIFKRSYNVNLPKSRSEAEEFGPGKKGLVMCQNCDSTYFKKSWHHDLENVEVSEKKDVPIRFVLCPACQMIKNKQYEGRIVIKNVPEKSMVKLEELINGFCRRAYERDPMDRLIEIKKTRSAGSRLRQGFGGQAGQVFSEWIVTTTENQLANKLAQKIKSSFSGVKTKTKFNKEPSDVVGVVVDF
ncbi:MAG: hypothetical protein A3I24_01465 [Candidatus Harrisonbacteria bacterium RIFCSPLOWO2_02_FULL_41_13b]|uniref:Nmd3 N-terminal domain-containing protein n=1 Tax=Candidatus Harrisonbacteria bacterium RIFCSPLOWO2_02_FULL_41_13b TaxID=1798409 RepID=A0A1G1ZTD5_9BACT|nr:MAG: hypothetical protein A3I24_01465 [Candidatus Harrisonbacteria bacterium RIFCSPLOWO2_02_FULL_41_13b]